MASVQNAYESARTVLNNVDETIVPAGTSQAVGTTVYGPFYNAHSALRLAVNITDVAGGGTLTVTIQGYDNTSGATWTALASTALNAAALTRLTVGPNIAASANAIAQDYAPCLYRVSCVVATAAVVFSIGAHQLG